MAITNQYPIDDDTRAALIERAKEIALYGTNERAQCAGIRACVAMDQLNLGREKIEQDARTPGLTLNVFDRANVLLQQLQSPQQLTPTQAPEPVPPAPAQLPSTTDPA